MRFRFIHSTSLAAISLLVAGCVTAPPAYTGPTAVVADSFKVNGVTEVEFFYVELVNGEDIRNASSASYQASRGQGVVMSPVPVERALPATARTALTLVARTQHAAPIVALFSSGYRVEGVLTVNLEPNARYVVRGRLGPETATCAVWLENEATGQAVGAKREVPCAEAK